MQVLLLCQKIYGSLWKDSKSSEGCTADFRKDTELVHKKIPFEIRFEKG